MESIKRKKISVIVTLYNRLNYARNMIKALNGQTQKIDELIFADDGSSEKLMEFIGDLLPECKYEIKHVYQEDLGFRLARSRNNGAREAEGDFLIFLDQDVILPPDFIEKMYQKRGQKEILFTRAIMSSESQRDKIQKIMDERYNFAKISDEVLETQDAELRKYIRKDLFYRFLYKIKLRGRGAKIVGLIFALYKEDYFNINGFDENYRGWGYEDDDFVNRFYKYGGEAQPVLFKKYPVHMFHPSAPSKSQSLNEDYYRDRKKNLNRKNYRAENGIQTSHEKDEVEVFTIK